VTNVLCISDRGHSSLIKQSSLHLVDIIEQTKRYIIRQIMSHWNQYEMAYVGNSGQPELPT